MDIYFDVILHSIVLVLIFRSRIRYQIVNFGLIIFYTASIIQLIFVGYKWQYVPLYVIICTITTLHFFNIEIKNRFSKVFYYVLIISIIGIGVTLTYIFPIPKFAIENKQYSVGYEELHVVVSDREQLKHFMNLVIYQVQAIESY